MGELHSFLQPFRATRRRVRESCTRGNTLHAKHISTLHVKGDLSRQAGERHWARYLTGTGASLQALCGSSLALRLFGGLICSEGPMLGELQISGRDV